jgi:hypothetical protein
MGYTITNSLINVGSAKQMYDISDFQLISSAIQPVNEKKVISLRKSCAIFPHPHYKRGIN